MTGLHPHTLDRLASIDIPSTRPVLVVDADEVILLFAQDFDAWLRPYGIWFDYNLYGYAASLKNRDGCSIGLERANALVDQFNHEGTRHHTAAPGAIDALRNLGSSHTILVLTNVPMACLEDREANFRDLGLNLPIIANVGPKGPALRRIMERAGGPVAFVDDNPNQIASAARDAPAVTRIHFTGCDRLRPALPPAPSAQHRPKSWDALVTLLKSAHQSL